jgi:hypothetical protein
MHATIHTKMWITFQPRLFNSNQHHLVPRLPNCYCFVAHFFPHCLKNSLKQPITTRNQSVIFAHYYFKSSLSLSVPIRLDKSTLTKTQYNHVLDYFMDYPHCRISQNGTSGRIYQLNHP